MVIKDRKALEEQWSEQIHMRHELGKLWGNCEFTAIMITYLEDQVYCVDWFK